MRHGSARCQPSERQSVVPDRKAYCYLAMDFSV